MTAGLVAGSAKILYNSVGTVTQPGGLQLKALHPFTKSQESSAAIGNFDGKLVMDTTQVSVSHQHHGQPCRWQRGYAIFELNGTRKVSNQTMDANGFTKSYPLEIELP